MRHTTYANAVRNPDGIPWSELDRSPFNRLLINTSPEPLTNWTASIVEDIMVIGGIWAAVNYPWVFLVLLVIFIVLMIWLLPKCWRGIKMPAAKIKELFTPRQASPPLT